MVEPFAPQGADHALDEPTPTRRPGRRDDLLQAHHPGGSPQLGPVDRVAIADEDARRAPERRAANRAMSDAVMPAGNGISLGAYL